MTASTPRSTALSSEEMTAVVVAVTLLTKARPVAVTDDARETPPWRFSGRRFGTSPRFR